MYLAKSDYTHYYLQCPIHVWAWKHRRAELEKHAQDPARLWMLEQGASVESIARLRFPEGRLIEAFDDAGATRTRVQIDAGATTLFQATGGRLLAIADILRLDSAAERYDLFEVKSSTEPKDEHIHDLCFQRMAFRNAGFKIRRLHLIYVNREFIRNGEIDPHAFLVVKDVTASADAIEDLVAANVAHALSVIDHTAVPTRQSLACTCTPTDCPCGQYCYPGLPAYSIFDLARIRGAKARALYDQGIRALDDLPGDFKLTELQDCQVRMARSGKPLIRRAEILEPLQKLSYPLYFLDYETFSSVIPLFDGYKPYEQIVFQYSLHVLRSPGGETEHCEYLANDLRDPQKMSLKDVTSRLRRHR